MVPGSLWDMKSVFLSTEKGVFDEGEGEGEGHPIGLRCIGRPPLAVAREMVRVAAYW